MTATRRPLLHQSGRKGGDQAVEDEVERDGAGGGRAGPTELALDRLDEGPGRGAEGGGCDEGTQSDGGNDPRRVEATRGLGDPRGCGRWAQHPTSSHSREGVCHRRGAQGSGCSAVGHPDPADLQPESHPDQGSGSMRSVRARLWRLCCMESKVNRANAIHTMPKPIHRAGDTCSPRRSTRRAVAGSGS